MPSSEEGLAPPLRVEPSQLRIVDWTGNQQVSSYESTALINKLPRMRVALDGFPLHHLKNRYWPLHL